LSRRQVERLALALSAVTLLRAEPLQTPSSAEIRLLVPDDVIEREMRAGETHRYSIELRQGEYFQAVVEQNGVDVAETVAGPDGQTLLEMDSFSAASGPDPLAFIASAAGRHTLTLRASNDEPPYRYALRVEAVREPNSLDRLRVDAVRATGDAASLTNRGPGEARQALELNRRALESWRALGDRRMEIYTQEAIGFIHRAVFGEFKDATRPFEAALATARAVGDKDSEGRLLFGLGLTYRKLGRFAEASASLEQAIALHRSRGRHDREGYLLMMYGRLLLDAGDPQLALDRMYEALDVYQPMGDLGDQVDPRTEVRLHLGDAYLELNDPGRALAQYQAAESRLRERESRSYRSKLAQALTGIGAARFGLGDLQGARAAYREALAIRQTLGAPAAEAQTRLRMGDVLREEGELSAALQVFTSALDVFRAAADPLGQAEAHCRLGEIRRRLGDADAARSAFETALAVAPALSAAARLCGEQGLARHALDAADLEASIAHAETALEQAESWRASVASRDARASTLAAQHSLYELLIEARARQHEHDPSGGHAAAALEASERARARSLLEMLDEGRVQVREGLEPTLAGEERALRQQLDAAAQLQREALGAKRAEQADSAGQEIALLTGRLAETEARIRRASPRYAALTQPAPLGLTGIQREVLDDDTLLLEYALGESRSFVWVVSKQALATFTLAPRAEIERAARRAHASLAEVPAGAQSSAKRLAPDGPAPAPAAIDELSALVLPAPVASLLNRKRLLVVAPEALQYIPFGVLRAGQDIGAPLLARFEVVSAPSASVVATLRQEHDATTGKRTVAVFADPVFDLHDPRVSAGRRARGAGTQTTSRASVEPLERSLRSVGGSGIGALARLPFSGREAAGILALTSEDKALRAIGFEATLEAATSPGLRDYRLVHFATHGILNTRHPDLSGVVLSLVDRQGRERDGFLRLRDVYNLRLDADVVVLSGCQTGLGKELRGEGLLGLTRGFMYAGARSVLASLWRVDDESTAELMKRFYRAMLKEGRRPAAALRIAQLELSHDRRWSAPFYWAGFVLQGDWR
jgi:CHAT domain-containing protein/tetratricopeptide (TPR) repeat protein